MFPQTSSGPQVEHLYPGKPASVSRFRAISGWPHNIVTECSSVSWVAQPNWLFVMAWATAHQAFLSIINFWSLLKLISTESVMPSNHPILCHPVIPFSSCLQSFLASGSFKLVSSLHQVAKYWSFSFSICPTNECSGLISFKIDWLDLFAVQGTLKRLVQQSQFKSINSSALSFLYSPTLTSIHDYWKSHSFG